MDSKALEELRNKYIKNPPEGMTAKLVKNMSDSDLLDMHYFLTEDDDWDGDEPEEGFYIDLFQQDAQLTKSVFKLSLSGCSIEEIASKCNISEQKVLEILED